MNNTVATSIHKWLHGLQAEAIATRVFMMILFDSFKDNKFSIRPTSQIYFERIPILSVEKKDSKIKVIKAYLTLH